MKKLISEEVRAFRADVRARARGAGGAKRQDRYVPPTRAAWTYRRQLMHAGPACPFRRATRSSPRLCARTRLRTAPRLRSPRPRARCVPAARCSMTRAPSLNVSSRAVKRRRGCTSWRLLSRRELGVVYVCAVRCATQQGSRWIYTVLLAVLSWMEYQSCCDDPPPRSEECYGFVQDIRYLRNQCCCHGHCSEAV
jgi:hypothetical protein